MDYIPIDVKRCRWSQVARRRDAWHELRTISPPLVPAKAGTQQRSRRVGNKRSRRDVCRGCFLVCGSHLRRSPLASSALGPRIRGDERMRETVIDGCRCAQPILRTARRSPHERSDMRDDVPGYRFAHPGYTCVWIPAFAGMSGVW